MARRRDALAPGDYETGLIDFNPAWRAYSGKTLEWVWRCRRRRHGAYRAASPWSTTGIGTRADVQQELFGCNRRAWSIAAGSAAASRRSGSHAQYAVCTSSGR